MAEHNALIATRRGRPAVLEKDGCRVYIAVHDEFYRRRKAEFKNRLKLAHPDMMPVTRIEVAAASVKAHTGRWCMRGRRGAYQQVAYERRRHSQRHRNRGREFRAVDTAYRKWLAEEAAWYAAHGLKPPEWNGDRT